MVSSTVSWSAAALMISSVFAHRGVTAAEEESGVLQATEESAGQRVHLPIKGVEFYARSVRLAGTKVIATGDLRARLERFPRVEVRAARLEYRVGGDKAKLYQPVWTYPVDTKESERLEIRAESATFRIDDQTVVAKTIRLQADDGRFQVSLDAPSGTWRPESRVVLLQSIEGAVLATTDRDGRGSRVDEEFRVRIRQATAQLSPDMALTELRLERISGREMRNDYVFEAARGVLDSSRGAARLREARLTGVKVITPWGHTFESDTVSYRPPAGPDGREGDAPSESEGE